MINLNAPTPYMTEADWRLVRRFKPTENWGDWHKVHRRLVFALDALAEFADRPVILHNAYDEDGHTDGSYHYRGLAADIHIAGLHVMDQFIIASRFDEFNGIGVYPGWNNPGLHLDIRPSKDRLSPDSRWLRTRGGVYLPLTWKNLMEAL